MKAAIYAGALTAALWGAAAWAADGQDCPPGYKPSASATQSSSAGTGGSGASASASVGTPQEGADATATQNEVSVSEEGARAEAQTHQEQQGTGGSGSVDGHCVPDTDGKSTAAGVRQEQSGVGGAGLTHEPARQNDVTVRQETEVSPKAFEADEEVQKKESTADMRGLTVLVGGGVEGYSFALAPEISPGPAWNVTAAIKPTRALGLELGYSGAVNEVKGGLGVDLTDGDLTDSIDVVRNGGQAVATLGLPTPLQPYILGGIGVSRYNVRGETAGGRLQDDTTGHVPAGAGLRAHLGNFTADARFTYNFLFDQEFARGTPNSDIGAPGDSTFDKAGRYLGTLNIGTTF